MQILFLQRNHAMAMSMCVFRIAIQLCCLLDKFKTRTKLGALETMYHCTGFDGNQETIVCSVIQVAQGRCKNALLQNSEEIFEKISVGGSEGDQWTQLCRCQSDHKAILCPFTPSSMPPLLSPIFTHSLIKTTIFAKP